MRCNKLKMTGVLILGVGMSGCAVSEAVKGWDNRYGPDPAMPLAKVQESIKNQNGIMAELENQVQGKDGSINYMNVTLAGFNFVDEQCDAYLKELFAIDQERNRLKSGITDTGLMTNAVLTATSASKASMALVTSAFGLSGQFSDSFADSYLYGKHTSTILTVVQKLQTAERDKLGSAKSKPSSRPEAYGWIRSYLQLCMPPTIEAQMEQALVGSQATGPKNADGNTATGTGSDKAVTFQAPAQ